MREKWFLRKQSRPNLWVQGVFVILVICAFASPALAHRVVIFAFTEGNTVHTESKFMPNTPVKQGKIMVMDAKTGKELLTGQTDDNGKFSFNIPPEAQKADLKIVVEAAMGHRGEWLLKAK
jgi:nickel transport protein